MIVRQSSFLLELDTEQIPRIFEVKLNTDATTVNMLQSKYHTILILQMKKLSSWRTNNLI